MVDIQQTSNENLEQQYLLKFNKFLQSIKDESKIKRRQAIEGISKEIKQLIEKSSLTNELAKFLLKNLLPLLNDQFEKCRELTVELLIFIHNKSNLNNDLLSIIILALRQRIGQKDITEPSEELRLNLYEFVYNLINKSEKNVLSVHIDDLFAILQNSFLDNYAEVKKKGCLCTRELAKKVKSDFHKQSESLIKPLILNITHQHSRVRKDIVDCIGDVILYGNNKSVDDVLFHLSQRLFDQAHIVRQSVITVVGMWLLDLLDRYSFHHKLIPLLLTGFSDEIPEIQDSAETYWWDIGWSYLIYFFFQSLYLFINRH
jgi:dynein assembly factor 5